MVVAETEKETPVGPEGAVVTRSPTFRSRVRVAELGTRRSAPKDIPFFLHCVPPAHSQ